MNIGDTLRFTFLKPNVIMLGKIKRHYVKSKDKLG